MFDVEWVELTDFKSYQGKHLIKFPTAPGLYLLTGKNLLNPRLGPNACGKTTILDAVHWAIFGRTARGLKAADVVGWHAKRCAVALGLRIGARQALIRRTQNPNSLTLDGVSVSQDHINKHIRMNESAFDYAVMLPQFGTSFFDLTPTAKLTLFSEILELDYWLDKSNAATSITAEIAANIEANHRKQATLQGTLYATEQDIENLKPKIRGFTQAKHQEKSMLESRLDEVCKDISFNEKRIMQNGALINAATVKLGILIKKAGSCPTCGQPLPEPEDQRALQRNLRDFEEELRGLQLKLNTLQGNKQRLEKDIAAIPKQANPYTDLLKAKEQSLVKLKSDQAVIAGEIKTLEREHTAISFWVTGFKRVRLMIVEQTLQQLELEVNNNLASLGLADWHITFDVERETKAGGISKGFVVFVHAPGRDEPVRFEAWSGGETQRLRMAGDLGLANLIMERAGLVNTIEWYDEPSQHLSQEGLLDLAETLAQRAVANNKRIILVDHHAIDFGDFAGVLTVTKDENGSHLIGG